MTVGNGESAGVEPQEGSAEAAESSSAAPARRRDWVRGVIWTALVGLCGAGGLSYWWLYGRGAGAEPGLTVQQELAAAEQAVQANPKDFAARMRLGHLYYGARNASGAAEQFEAATELEPRHAAAYAYLGHAYGQRGDAILAGEAFEKAIELDPRSLEGYIGLALSYYVRARIEDAKEALRRALAWCPRTASAHMRLAGTYTYMDLQSEAVEQYQEVLRLDPDNASAHFYLGKVLTDRSEWEKAQVELEKAAALGLEDARLYYYAGLAHMRTGHTAESTKKATDYLHQAIELDPRAPEPHHRLGQLADRKGDLEGARRYHEKAIELGPWLSQAHHDLSRVYVRLGRREDAEREMAAFRELREKEAAEDKVLHMALLRPDDAKAQLALGRFYLEEGAYVEATTSLQTAEALAPDNVEVHRLLRKVYEETDRPDDAQRQAELVAQLGEASR